MANRTRINTAGKTGQHNITSNSPTLTSSHNLKSKEKNDDLIVSLTDAYENRRARQVSEWERLYGNNVYRAV